MLLYRGDNMLYPKTYKENKENKLIEKLKYIKGSIFSFFRAFKNCNSFILFIKQKFHF